MKVIFSRKGFDSQYGGMPSPILPDGTLLSLPIPSKEDTTKYADLTWNGKSYYELIQELKPSSRIKANYTCHLDPDIRKEATSRLGGWKSAFGQTGSALGHLQKQKVGIGDLFLFFGSFRQTEFIDGKLSYVKGASDLHVIYGYLQVGDIVCSQDNVPQWLAEHPHAKTERWKQPNAIFIASDLLSFCPEQPGAGCLSYTDKLVLTKQGYSKSIWDLPDFFRDIPITYNANAWKDDCFVSAAKGQEFVFEANDKALEWIEDLLSAQ